MLRQIILLTAASIIVAAGASCSKEQNGDNGVQIFSARGGDVNTALNRFRQQLGATLNTTPGAAGGRREINWDGVPAAFVNTDMPPDFFNPLEAGAPASRQRGLVYSSSGGSFRVSNNLFADVNSNAAGQFAAFSGNQTFANTGANLWDIGFQVPGQSTQATVKGFGIVFSDVDRDNSTYLEFFNGGVTLGRFYVPAHDAGSSFSFLGVYFNYEKVTRVRVVHEGRLAGGGKDISNGGSDDLIILDDFLYSEPISY